MPDDAAMPQDVEKIAQARKEYEAGETVSHDSINWD